MNARALAKNYGHLTPEERFWLILAASGRGDEVEQDRLLRAGGRITLSMPDDAPYAHAFDELALLTFLELLEDAARYLDAFDRADGDDCCAEAEDETDENDDGGEAADERIDEEGDDASRRPAWQRSLDVALAAGYVLKAKADGWRLFCERMHVAPFLLVQELPGFDRLQRALALAAEVAFGADRFLRWLNAVRPAGVAGLTEVTLTATSVAAATEEMFRRRVQWWGG